MGSIANRVSTLAVACALAAFCSVACSQQRQDHSVAVANSPATTLTDAQIVDRFGDAVYRVEVQGCGLLQGSGSAFAVDAHHLITNRHVVALDPSVSLVSRSGERLQGKVVAADKDHDVAVIATHETLKTSIPLANPADVKVGGHIDVLGYPAPDVTFSALPGEVTGMTAEGYLKTDARGDHGDSGGPGITDSGKAAGVFFAVAPTEVQTVGLLLPVSGARQLLAAAYDGSGRYDVTSCADLQSELQAFYQGLLGQLQAVPSDVPSAPDYGQSYSAPPIPTFAAPPEITPTPCISKDVSVTNLTFAQGYYGSWNISGVVTNTTSVEISLYSVDVGVALDNNPSHYDDSAYLSPPNTSYGLSPGQTVNVTSMFYPSTDGAKPVGVKWTPGHDTWSPADTSTYRCSP